MVTPAFRPGECGPIPPVWKTAPSYGMSSPPASHGRDIDTIPKRHLSGEYRPPDGLAWCIRLPRPKGRGYRKVRLSGELCLSGECRSPDTGYLGGSAKDFCLPKSFATAPFLFPFPLIKVYYSLTFCYSTPSISITSSQRNPHALPVLSAHRP